MSAKLTYTRSPDGTFNFTEQSVGRFNAKLRPRVGQQGPILPESFMRAASTELIRAIHQVADARGLPFGVAAARVVRERPELFWLTRGLAVPDGDPTADVDVPE